MREALPERERVPSYYCRSEQTRAILEALTDASLEAKAALEDVIDQFFVETATWGLDHWEAQVGLSPGPGQSVDARRAAVRQKLVANGNTTEEMVQGIAEAVTGYRARVLLHEDYSFSLEFWGEKTTLAAIDIAEVYAMVEQIKPAHLKFVITGLRWMDFESLGLTWAWFDKAQPTWNELEGELFCVHGPEAG